MSFKKIRARLDRKSGEKLDIAESVFDLILARSKEV